jgi:hypothetical protein
MTAAQDYAAMLQNLDRKQYIEQITAWLRLFIEPGQVTELRAIKVRRQGGKSHTEAGFFDSDHLAQMAEAACYLRWTPLSRPKTCLP